MGIFKAVFFFKNRHSINLFFIQIVLCRETSLLINKIKNRSFNINFEENFTYVKSTFRKENNYFYKLFCNNEYRTINYFFFLEQNEFSFYSNFLIRFSI